MAEADSDDGYQYEDKQTESVFPLPLEECKCNHEVLGVWGNIEILSEYSQCSEPQKGPLEVIQTNLQLKAKPN